MICCLFMTATVFGQQWNGPSNTNGGIYRLGNVGIGYTNVATIPQARLDINLASSTTEEGYDVFGSHIRLNKTNAIWDVTGGTNLNFKYGTTASNQSSVLSMSNSSFAFLTGENQFHLGAMNSPLSNQGQYFAFGATPTSGAWTFTGNSTNNGGAIIHGDNQGNLLFITRGTDASNNMSVNETADNVRLRIHGNGKISIGTGSTTNDINEDGDEYLLFVKGGTLAEEVAVQTGWADYVFDSDYDLLPLEKVENHINIYGHLHNTPSADELNGTVNLGDATVQQQEKIEEIYLHLIEMNKRMKILEEENERLKVEMENIKK